MAFADQPSIGPPVTQVVVRTAAGQVTDRLRATGQPQRLRTPPGATGWLQITVTGLAAPPSRFGTQVAIREVTIPGVRARRVIVAPAGPARLAGRPAPAAVVLAKTQPWPSGCMRTWLRWVCSPSLIVPAEEQFGFDHAFTAAAASHAALRGSAVLASASRASAYLGAARGGVQVHASSSYTPSPQDQARAAFDGDPATVWTASTTDAQPILTISWRRPRTVRRITIQRPPDAAGLLQVLMAGSHGQVRGGSVGPSGVVRFAPMRTTKLVIRFTPLRAPLQISGVMIPGVPQLRTSSAPLRLRCGLGPLIEVNGRTVPTRAWGSDAALLAQRPLHFAACSPVGLRPGTNEVIEPAGDAFSVQDVVVGHVPAPAAAGAATSAATAAAPAARARILAWTSSRRVLRVAARPGLLPGRERELQPRVAGGHRRPDVAGRAAGRLEAGLAAARGPQRPGDPHLPAGYALPGRDLRRAGLACADPDPRAPAAGVDPPPPRPCRCSAPAPAPAAARAPTPALARRPVIARVLVTMGLASGLVLAGLWLGGYPGAALLPVTTAGFLAAARSRGSWPRPPGPRLSRPWITSPWLAAGLLLAATAAGVAGEHLVLSGSDGPVALWLVDGVPQVICLVVIGRLAAALIAPPPDPG